MDQDETQTQTLNWQQYSYDELLDNPELQAEYDAMLASRPIWPSRIFVASAILAFLVLLLCVTQCGA